MTTSVYGNPELMELMKYGFLVSYNNEKEIITALKDVLRDRELSDRLVADGIKTIRLFPVQSMLAKLITAIS